MNCRQGGGPGRFEVEFQSLREVVKRDIGRLALARNVNLQSLGYKPTVLLPDNRGQLFLLHR